jgi:hypothetical protein
MGGTVPVREADPERAVLYGDLDRIDIEVRWLELPDALSGAVEEGALVSVEIRVHDIESKLRQVHPRLRSTCRGRRTVPNVPRDCQATRWLLALLMHPGAAAAHRAGRSRNESCGEGEGKPPDRDASKADDRLLNQPGLKA